MYPSKVFDGDANELRVDQFPVRYGKLRYCLWVLYPSEEEPKFVGCAQSRRLIIYFAEWFAPTDVTAEGCCAYRRYKESLNDIHFEIDFWLGAPCPAIMMNSSSLPSASRRSGSARRASRMVTLRYKNSRSASLADSSATETSSVSVSEYMEESGYEETEGETESHRSWNDQREDGNRAADDADIEMAEFPEGTLVHGKHLIDAVPDTNTLVRER